MPGPILLTWESISRCASVAAENPPRLPPPGRILRQMGKVKSRVTMIAPILSNDHRGRYFIDNLARLSTKLPVASDCTKFLASHQPRKREIVDPAPTL